MRGHTGEVEADPIGGAALEVGEGGQQREFELGMGTGAPIPGGVCGPRVMGAAGCSPPGETHFQHLKTRWGTCPPRPRACRWALG